MLPICLLLGLIWGLIWALCLHASPLGRYLVQQQTWLTVVIGVGVDLLILAFALPLETWLLVCAPIAASALGIIGRSLLLQAEAHRAAQTALKVPR